MSRSRVQVTFPAPKHPANILVCGVFLRPFAGYIRALAHKLKEAESTGEKGFAFSPVLFLCSHDMRHKTPHLLRRLLLHQQIHRFLGDGDFSGIGRCLGPSHLDPSALDDPLGYQQCFALHLQIAPEQGGQFAFPQAADSFHKEHREHPAGICLP